MKWVPLEFANLPAIEAQVDEVVKTHDALSDQLRKKKGGSNLQQIAKAHDVLRQMMHQRILAMEKFYQENDLDPRCQRVENSRLRLKRLLKGFQDSGGVGGSTGATSGAADATGNSPVDKHNSSTGKGGSKANASSKQSPRRGAGANSASGAANTGVPNLATENAKGADAKPLTLKIQMTHNEFEVLRMRREAMRDLAKVGGSSATGQAWENAFQAHQNRTGQGFDSHTQGTHTFHDIPYQGDHFKEQALMRGTSFKASSGGGGADGGGNKPPFRTMMKPDQNPDPGFIGAGAGPYVSANSEVVSRTLRYSNNQEAMKGGAAAMDKKNSFKSIVPRTRITTTGHKAEPMGGGTY